jgi:predicted nucleotidyltransferase
MLRAYVVKDTTVISLIQQNSTFKKMTLDDVLDKIINHEMLVEEANHAKNLSKGITSSKK